MRSERSLIWIGLLFAGLVIVLAFVSVGCAADTYTVCSSGCDYTSIQAAVAAADSFDTIIVRDGIYTENIDVTVDNVTIRSENGSANCFVNALDPSDHVFRVTADYVNISGFTVQNAVGAWRGGLYLTNVDHCAISENTVSNNANGIYLASSSNNILTGNTALNNTQSGICLVFSSKNTLTGNTASNKTGVGIYLESSSKNTLTGNTALNNTYVGINLVFSSNDNTLTSNIVSNSGDGINLHSTSNNTIANNTMVGDGIGIAGVTLEHWNTHFIDISNTINGKPVYYWKDQVGGTVPLGAGQVILAHCTNVVVENQNVSDGCAGITLGFSKSIKIANNTASNNNAYGIRLSSSSNNTLMGNTLSNNYHGGIDLHSSSNNNLTGNTASNNGGGIYLSSSSNYNNLTGNTLSNNEDGIGIFTSSNYNNLTGNIVLNNPDGIYLYKSNNNTLTGNTVSNSFWYGILMQYSSNNHIYNNFFNNKVNARDGGNNIWNITKTHGTNIIGGSWLGGNYWSDYKGVDTDGDSLGDTLTPYNCSGKITTGGDWLPLVKAFTELPVGVKSNITLADPEAIAAYLPPEYDGVDISDAVVLTVNVTDDTPGNSADDAYTDITINVGAIDIATCKVFKSDLGFLPEVSDISTLLTVKPPGEPAFSRNLANNTVTVRLYVGDPLLAVLPLAAEPPSRWDINEDCTVNFIDLTILSAHWLETPTAPYPRYDINEDSNVNFIDLTILSAHWLESTC